MARPALAASRAIDILNFMASAPLRSYSLTDLVRAVGLNPASCHALVNAMVRDGYLVRHAPSKTYRLGPALITIGQGALQCHPPVAMAREPMVAIAQEFGLCCALTVLAGGNIIVLAVEGQGAGPLPRIGQSVPIIPPIGTPFLAWAGDAEVEAWLAQAEGGPGGGAERERLRAALAAARERGYAVTRFSARQGEASKALAVLADAPFENERRMRAIQLLARMDEDYLLIESRPDQLHHVLQISAPVFGADRAVACTLSLLGFDGPLSSARLADLGRRLRGHADRVTAAVAAHRAASPE